LGEGKNRRVEARKEKEREGKRERERGGFFTINVIEQKGG